jgi:hypothetical protein
VQLVLTALTIGVLATAQRSGAMSPPARKSGRSLWSVAFFPANTITLFERFDGTGELSCGRCMASALGAPFPLRPFASGACLPVASRQGAPPAGCAGAC